jgi:UDP-hydrolysing UDP-N-acetyl-D-glucosamine 2-epimerase
MDSKKIAFFTGSRAELGILFPLIYELRNDFAITIVVSGPHLLPPWNTIAEIIEKNDTYKINADIYTIPLENLKDTFRESLSVIFDKSYTYLAENHYDFAIVLGDRIETLGFVIAAFFNAIPIAHIAGGEFSNAFTYDEGVRHSITKMSQIHFVTNEISEHIIKQLGEENWRVFNVGTLTFDYDRQNLLPSKNDLLSKYKINDNEFIIFLTYHPLQMVSEEQNLLNFKTTIKAVTDSNTRTIMSYPSNESGGNLILQYLPSIIETELFTVIPNLGSLDILSLFKHFKVIVVGNSSMGLLETCFYSIPTINIGNRQTDRIRSSNVFDVEDDYTQIFDKIIFIKDNYHDLKTGFEKGKYFFGDGSAALKSANVIRKYIDEPKDNLILKKFIIRDFNK